MGTRREFLRRLGLGGAAVTAAAALVGSPVLSEAAQEDNITDAAKKDQLPVIKFANLPRSVKIHVEDDKGTELPLWAPHELTAGALELYIGHEGKIKVTVTNQRTFEKHSKEFELAKGESAMLDWNTSWA